MNDTTALATIEPTAMAVGETATAAQASQAQALVLAQYTMAERHPRRMLDVANKLADECKRPRFAEKARYSIPYKSWDPTTRKSITTYVEGFSIRFAEAAIRLLGNVLIQTPIVHDDDDKRIGRVFVIDLERNTIYASDVTVEKVVERKQLKQGQQPIRVRKNSFGDTVYVVAASEQDFRAKWQSELSKAIRTNALRLVPADILEDCEEQLAQTISDADAKDPGAALKRLARAFADVGVPVVELEKLLGHSIETVSPAEIERLRGIYTAISDGVASWSEILDVETTAPPKGEDDPNATLRKKLQSQLKPKTQRKSAPKVINAEVEPAPKADDKAPSKPGKGAPVLTAEEVAQGWEIDPDTGELVPPPGWDG